MGQVVQDVLTGASEYWPAEQFVQLRSEVVEKSLRQVPAAQAVRFRHGTEPLGDQEMPMTQAIALGDGLADTLGVPAAVPCSSRGSSSRRRRRAVVLVADGQIDADEVGDAEVDVVAMADAEPEAEVVAATDAAPEADVVADADTEPKTEEVAAVACNITTTQS